MNFTIPTNHLKGRGYTFQKLYASEYKTYRKEFGNYKEYIIWLWVKNKTIEINDWFHLTENVIKFFKDNIEAHTKKYEGTEKSMKNYLRFWLDRQTGETHEYTNMFNRPKGEVREIVLFIPYFSEVVKEVDFITQPTVTLPEN